MKVELGVVAARQLRDLGSYYERKPYVLGPTRPSDEQVVSYAIAKLHEQASKQSDWAGASAGRTGGSDMQYAVQEEKSSGFVTLSLHDSASDAQAAWDKEFGFDIRAQGRIVEVPPHEIAMAGATDARPAPKVVTRLGYER